MPLDQNKLNRLEELKNKLFSKNYQTKIEYRDGFSPEGKKDLPDSWGGDVLTAPSNHFFMKTSLFKKVFMFSVAFFALSLGYALFVFFAGSNTVSNENIEITVLGNNFTEGGEALDLIVGITNKNSSSLDLADLVVEYPTGSSLGVTSDTERIRQSLGTIPAGAVRNESLKLVLFGEQGTIRPIRITLEYRVAGSNSIFVKEKMFNVNINSTPVNLSVQAPSFVSPNQSINLEVLASLNSTKPAEDMLLRIDYPPGFQFVKSTPAPFFSNNVWDLGDLSPGAENKIALSGKMIDVFDGEEKTFNISSGSRSSSNKSVIGVVFNSIKHTVVIRKPFIEASLFINGVGDREYAVDAKTPLNVEVRYKNNTETRLSDLTIKTKISGNAFNRSTVRPQQGHYESSSDTIIWDKTSTNALRELDPGESDSVSFSVSPLSLLSSEGVLLADPKINIDVDMEGAQTAEGLETARIENSADAVVRIISDVGFAAKALHYSGPFQNSGPVPPKPDVETTFTVVWSLSNTSNSISRAEVVSSLPAWVKFEGSFSPASEDVTYNPSTREIKWRADRISKGAGISAPTKSVAFKVILKPSLSQVGSMPVIINEAVLTGHDDFANVDIRATKAPLNTKLESDTAFPANGGVVVSQ